MKICGRARTFCVVKISLGLLPAPQAEVYGFSVFYGPNCVSGARVCNYYGPKHWEILI